MFGSLLGTAERRVATLTVAAALGIGVIAFRSWLEAHDERMQMTATIASQNSIIAAAEKREQDRQQQLADTLKQIEDLKRSVQTPQQVIREMPQFLPPLPQPLETVAPKSAAAASGQPGSSGTAQTSGGDPQKSTQTREVPAPDMRVPSADLKPLFDFVQDCRACQAKLTAALQDAQDQRTKNDALTRERDAAVKAAKGGGVWSRTVRAAKWVAAGFAVGYLAHAAVR
jgi:peptidoglycan hydrolase CwlO-like protein